MCIHSHFRHQKLQGGWSLLHHLQSLFLVYHYYNDEDNTYQNNIIPIYPELDDKEYSEYDCTNQYQYSPENISLADNRVKTNNDRDWLYFALNLRGEAKETLNIISMKSTEGTLPRICL